MARYVDELVRIAPAGGGFTIDGRNYVADQLVRIALAAQGHRPRVHITNAEHFPTDTLVRISLAGQGAVSFDL